MEISAPLLKGRLRPERGHRIRRYNKFPYNSPAYRPSKAYPRLFSRASFFWFALFAILSRARLRALAASAAIFGVRSVALLVACVAALLVVHFVVVRIFHIFSFLKGRCSSTLPCLAPQSGHTLNASLEVCIYPQSPQIQSIGLSAR